jgi:outer membrane protein OmpA-like peptidoglycan-associated protein
MKNFKQLAIVLALFGLIASGCSGMTRSQKGAVVGAAGGGAVGGVVGRVVGNTAMGVLIGATVGGVAGAVIGRKMDKQAEEMQKDLPDAVVKREGEGIVVVFNDKVLFGFDRSDLSSESRATLNKLSDVLKKYPDTNIEIIGHTDNVGSANYNQGLSERRANSAADYLRTSGINSTRLKTRGMGASDPKTSNDTDAGRAENRRVEFVITANEKMIEDAKREANQ